MCVLYKKTGRLRWLGYIQWIGGNEWLDEMDILMVAGLDPDQDLAGLEEK